MSLLSVTVKKARYVGAQASQFNTYVTLKLQNVKSTTVTVKGATPCWEQDFLFETSNLNTGLLIEVWSKGMIWDRALGYHWIPLQTVHYTIEEGNGQWLSLDAELVMKDGEVVGTKMATGHSLLVDCRFELPFDPESMDASDLQRKLETLNKWIDMEARTDQANRHYNFIGRSNSNQFDNDISAGYSEDSDYTSDLNYPVGQHPNSSASQFRSAAHQMNTPQRSLEASRENSYERDDSGGGQYLVAAPPTAVVHQHHLSPGGHRRHQFSKRYSPNDIDDYNNCYTGGGNFTTDNSRIQYPENNIDSDPLFYNSRPRGKTDILSQEIWQSCESSYYNQSIDSMDAGYSVDPGYYGSQSTGKRPTLRRKSLERQTTLYDDSIYYNDTSQTTFYTAPADVTQVNFVTTTTNFDLNQSGDEFYDSLSYPFQEERYGQDEEDRQWDSGGMIPYYNDLEVAPSKPPSVKTGKKLPAIPTGQGQKRRSSFTTTDEGYMGYGDENFRPSIPTPSGRRKMPQIPTKRSSSRQSSQTDEIYKFSETPPSHRGASLPPTPTKSTNSKLLAKLQTPSSKTPFNSLPATPGRQLPQPNATQHRSAKVLRNNRLKRTSSAEYEETDHYDNYYIRAGAASAQNYNEDYNYAYRSIEDNLPEEDNLPFIKTQVAPPVTEPKTNVSNTYFTAQDSGGFYGGNSSYYVKQLEYHQNATVESKNEERKEDSNGQYGQETKTYNDYGGAIVDLTRTNGYKSGDQQMQTKAIIGSTNVAATGAVTTDTVTSTTTPADADNKESCNQNYFRNQRVVTKQESIDKSGSRPYLTHHQDSVDESYNQVNGYQPVQNTLYDSEKDLQDYQPKEIITSNYNRGPLIEQFSEYDEDPYLEAQESVESYIEEDISGEIPPKPTIPQDSSPPQDVYGEEEVASLRRGSSQITVVDPYHPSLQQRTSLPQNRRSSDPPSRKLSDAGYPGYEDTYQKISGLDGGVIQRHGSLRQSGGIVPEVTVQDVDFQDQISEERIAEVLPEDPKKGQYEAEEAKEKVTAHARWLWAFNKILLQIHVSLTHLLLP